MKKYTEQEVINLLYEYSNHVVSTSIKNMLTPEKFINKIGR